MGSTAVSQVFQANQASIGANEAQFSHVLDTGVIGGNNRLQAQSVIKRFIDPATHGDPQAALENAYRFMAFLEKRGAAEPPVVSEALSQFYGYGRTDLYSGALADELASVVSAQIDFSVDTFVGGLKPPAESGLPSSFHVQQEAGSVIDIAML